MEADSRENEPFAGGPPAPLVRRLGSRPARADPRLGRTAALVAWIGWAPLPLLAELQGVVYDAPGISSFASDVAVHARSLVAAPILVLSEAVCAPRLSAIAAHFARAGLVPEEEGVRFAEVVRSTRVWLRSPTANLSLLGMAYALCTGLVLAAPEGGYPAWQFGGHASTGPGYLAEHGTLAGWWHAAVSLPILLFLFLGWVYRVLLWGRFLARVAWLRLRLVPAHPDLAAGLGFVGSSVRAFTPVAFAFGLVVAGSVTNKVILGTSLISMRYVVGVSAALIVALFVAPLLVFIPSLLAARRRGVLDYGAFGSELGRDLEDGWLHDLGAVRERGLEAQAFSAVNDGFQVVQNVYGLRVVPLDVSGALALAAAALLPFLPAVFISLPLTTVLETAAKMFF